MQYAADADSEKPMFRLVLRWTLDDDELENFYSVTLWKLHLKGALQRMYKEYTK